LAFLTFLKGVDWQIDGALKSAALAFVIAWAVLAFVIYVSSIWDKRRPLISFVWVLVGVIMAMVWWAYLPVEIKSERKPSPNNDEPEIIKRLEAELDRAELRRKYPLGYAIFYVDREERVIPYDAKALTEFELDWNTVSLAQHPDPRVETVILTMPTFRRKGEAQAFPKIGLMGPRRVGIIKCNMIPDSNWERTLSVCGEILSIKGRTIVFLVGVKHVRLPA